MMDKSTSRLLR